MNNAIIQTRGNLLEKRTKADSLPPRVRIYIVAATNSVQSNAAANVINPRIPTNTLLR